MATINLAREFSRTPSGRFRAQGDFSGQAFREDLLVPRLAKFARVEVVLDGASGLSSGFLDEAFAGVVRERVLTLSEFKSRVHVVCDSDPYLLDEIDDYVAAAAI